MPQSVFSHAAGKPLYLGDQMVEVNEHGQIVIPKYIRDMLKLTPGTNLSVSVEGGKIVLERYDPIEELDKIRAKHAIYTTKEVDRLMKKLDKKRHDELMKDVY
jgi:AbrB family looped-hinge helix DNA binding protein